MIKMFKHYFIPHEGNDYHPHFFRNTVLGFVAIITLSLLSLSLIGSATLKNKNLLGAIYASVLVDLTNKDRVTASLPTLSINQTLEDAAGLKAEDMIKNDYFAHVSPAGLTPWYWFTKAGYKFIYAGENLAIDFNESDAVENAWMNSPTHRANIMNNHFSEIGIAVREGAFEGKNTLFVVQMFAKPLVVAPDLQPIVVAPTPAPAKAVTKPAAAPKVTTVKTPVVATVPVPEVKGAEVEITTQNASENGANLFIAAKDPVAEAQSIKNTDIVGEPTAPKSNPPSSFWNKVIMRFPIALNTLYLILGGIITLALTMLVTIEVRHQRPKTIIFGIVLLLVVVGAAYANRSTELFALASSLY